jgi:hypothetical protein
VPAAVRNDERDVPLVLVNGTGAYAFLPPDALPVAEELAPVPVNGHALADCPDCDGPGVA